MNIAAAIPCPFRGAAVYRRRRMPYRSKSVPFEKDPSPRKGPSGAICLWFAPFCALILTGCGVSPNQEASGAVSAPSVVRTDPRESPAAREAAVLADRILRRENDDFLLDARRRRRLFREIERVLARIRDAYPAMAEISVREAHRPGMLLLGLEPDLFEVVFRLFHDARGSAAPRTGHAEFDALNAKLGLRAIRSFSSTGVVAMYFDERVNIDAARRAYRMMEGVRYAEPDARLGDGSDIEAAKSHETWHVVVRNAWGDCPAGCLYEEMSFFTVESDGVERIEPSRAKDMARFAEILARRGWH